MRRKPTQQVGLSTSCLRFPKKFPVISQKGAQKLLKKGQMFAVNADIF